ncbi:hypothetical protein [Paraburkholderia fungorum]|uniref:hypothetical protein n=1 Tax=Paraburkholderia fungorum TaxID=134537 RepID=UPI00115FE379|nr:hypothetical protein [Paraburkholderia fungorum]
MTALFKQAFRRKHIPIHNAGAQLPEPAPGPFSKQGSGRYASRSISPAQKRHVIFFVIDISVLFFLISAGFEKRVLHFYDETMTDIGARLLKKAALQCSFVPLSTPRQSQPVFE